MRAGFSFLPFSVGRYITSSYVLRNSLFYVDLKFGVTLGGGVASQLSYSLDSPIKIGYCGLELGESQGFSPSVSGSRTRLQ